MAGHHRRLRRCRSCGTCRCPSRIRSLDRCPWCRQSTCQPDPPGYKTRRCHRTRSHNTPHPRRTQKRSRSLWNRSCRSCSCRRRCHRTPVRWHSYRRLPYPRLPGRMCLRGRPRHRTDKRLSRRRSSSTRRPRRTPRRSSTRWRRYTPRRCRDLLPCTPRFRSSAWHRPGLRPWQ